MKYILYIILTVFLENGEPFKHEFRISFDKETNCVELKKFFDVGVSFLRLAHEHNINYEGQCKKIVSSKAIHNRRSWL